MKKQNDTVMCFGTIAWNTKGSFHMWYPESKDEKKYSTIRLKQINLEAIDYADIMNKAWKSSSEWAILWQENLNTQQQIKAKCKANNIKVLKIPQPFLEKCYKPEKLQRSTKEGIDSWRYVQTLC
jgi:hypothetical protein